MDRHEKVYEIDSGVKNIDELGARQRDISQMGIGCQGLRKIAGSLLEKQRSSPVHHHPRTVP